jgi:hypothetical protein
VIAQGEAKCNLATSEYNSSGHKLSGTRRPAKSSRYFAMQTLFGDFLVIWRGISSAQDFWLE